MTSRSPMRREQSFLKTIGHITRTFLEKSETFVYEQIIRNNWHRHLVLAKKRKNEGIFPIDAWIEFKDDAQLLPLLEQHRVDLIHAHFGPNALRVLKAKIKLGIPMLTFIHGYDARQFPRSKRQNFYAYQKLFKHGELFAVPSEAIKQELIGLGCPEGKVVVCHLGIDVNRFAFRERVLSGDTIKLISIGRLVEKKGHQHLIQALAIMERKMPHFHLTIIGEGQERDRLSCLIKQYGLQEKVCLLGSRPPKEVISELERAHIFCLASVTGKNGDMEGLPISILEAQSMGLPVVSTRHSGIPESVVDGQSAYLAEEANPSDFAEKLLTLMEHPEWWPKFGSCGRKWVDDHFHMEKQALKLNGIYNQLLGEVI